MSITLRLVINCAECKKGFVAVNPLGHAGNRTDGKINATVLAVLPQGWENLTPGASTWEKTKLRCPLCVQAKTRKERAAHLTLVAGNPHLLREAV